MPDERTFIGAQDSVLLHQRGFYGDHDRKTLALGLVPPSGFNPANGFPWNLDAGESFVQSQCWPDPTTDLAYAFGPPLNAVRDQSWAVESGEVQFQPIDDPSIQAWAVGPPQNAVTAQA